MTIAYDVANFFYKILTLLIFKCYLCFIKKAIIGTLTTSELIFGDTIQRLAAERRWECTDSIVGEPDLARL